MEDGPSSSPLRRHPFPLSTLLVVIGGVCILLSVIANWRNFGQQKRWMSEAHGLNSLQWGLAIETDRSDRDVELLFLPGHNPNRWAWFFRNNTDTLYNLYFSEGGIPAGGLPSRNSPAARYTKTIDGSCIIAVEIEGEGVSSTIVCLEPGRGGAFGTIAPAKIEFDPKTDIPFVAGASGVEKYAPSDTITLLRVSPPPASNAFDEFAIWVEPVGKRQPAHTQTP